MHFFRALLILMACLCASFAYADDVVVIQPLRFGTWYIPGNNAVYSVDIQTDGSYSNSPQLTMIEPPTEGIFDIGDLPVNTAINSLDVTENTPLEFSGSVFDMDDFETASSGVTDSNGRVTVTVGATASTTGGGGSYPSGEYTGSLDLNFDVNF